MYIRTIALVTLCMPFSFNAMQSPAWLRTEDMRTALIAAGAAATTWGAIESIKALVQHYSHTPDQVTALHKELDNLKKNIPTPDATIALHQLLLSYGLINQEGNFIGTKNPTTDFVVITTRIATITQCPDTVEAQRNKLALLSKQLNTCAESIRAMGTLVTTLSDQVGTLINGEQKSETEQSHALEESSMPAPSEYATLSDSALHDYLRHPYDRHNGDIHLYSHSRSASRSRHPSEEPTENVPPQANTK